MCCSLQVHAPFVPSCYHDKFKIHEGLYRFALRIKILRFYLKTYTMYKYATAWVVNKIANKNIYTPPNFINPVDKVSAGFLVHFEISVLKLYIYSCKYRSPGSQFYLDNFFKQTQYKSFHSSLKSRI